MKLKASIQKTEAGQSLCGPSGVPLYLFCPIQFHNKIECLYPYSIWWRKNRGNKGNQRLLWFPPLLLKRYSRPRQTARDKEKQRTLWCSPNIIFAETYSIYRGQAQSPYSFFMQRLAEAARGWQRLAEAGRGRQRPA